MTVKKSRAKTLQERFGFKDEDLRKPAHDQILLWLDANIDQIAPSFFKLEWDANEIKEQEEYAKKRFEEKKKDLEYNLSRCRRSLSNNGELYPGYKESSERQKEKQDELQELETKMQKMEAWQGLGELPERKIEVVQKIWERPIKSERDFLIGFIDMEVVCNRRCLSYYDDYSPKWTTGRDDFSLFFEAKTEIISIGEVMRQIQMYKTYVWQPYSYSRKYKFVLVCPDDKYASLFKEQGIEFLKYEGELPEPPNEKGQIELF